MAFDNTVLKIAIALNRFSRDNSFAQEINDMISIFIRGRSYESGFESPLKFKDNILILVQDRVTALKNRMSDPMGLIDPKFAQWFETTCNSTAGAWLGAIPAFAKLKMTSDRFQMSLRYRYFIPIVGSSMKCNNFLTNVDPQGHHLVSFCK